MYVNHFEPFAGKDGDYGSFTHLSTHLNPNNTSKTFKPGIHNVVRIGTNTAKIWLSLYLMGFVRFRCAAATFFNMEISVALPTLGKLP